MQVIEVPDTTPIGSGVLSLVPDDALVALEYQPQTVPVDNAQVLSVVVPFQAGAGGVPVTPGFQAQVEAALTSLDGRVGTIEDTTTAPLGGVLSGTLPSPGFASDMAFQSELDAGLASRKPRWTVRAVAADTQALVFDLLKVNASGGARTVSAPSSPVIGDQVCVIKTDTSDNSVTFNAATNSDAVTTIYGQWSGATFVYDGSIWLVESVNVAYSNPGTSGGGGTALTREQADARYDVLGAATTAVAGLTKTTVGLGNVDNTADTAKPVSTATQTALNGKADKANPVVSGFTSGSVTLNAAQSSTQAIRATGNITLAAPSNAVDQQSLRVEVYSDATTGGTKTVTTTGVANASGQGLPISLAPGKWCVLGLIYSSRAAEWMLSAYTVRP